MAGNLRKNRIIAFLSQADYNRKCWSFRSHPAIKEQNGGDLPRNGNFAMDRLHAWREEGGRVHTEHLHPVYRSRRPRGKRRGAIGSPQVPAWKCPVNSE